MIDLPPRTRAVLRELAEAGAAHDAATERREEKCLNLEWPTAEALYLAVRLAKRRRVLEIGTSNGFSAIWLASALESLGAGELISIERNPEKRAEARANLDKAGLAGRVTLFQGEATPLVAALEGVFDCVFFDADRVSAPEQLALLMPRLTPDALLLADNALSHPGEIAGYLAAVEASGEFDTTILPVGKGLHVAVRRSA